MNRTHSTTISLRVLTQEDAKLLSIRSPFGAPLLLEVAGVPMPMLWDYTDDLFVALSKGYAAEVAANFDHWDTAAGILKSSPDAVDYVLELWDGLATTAEHGMVTRRLGLERLQTLARSIRSRSQAESIIADLLEAEVSKP